MRKLPLQQTVRNNSTPNLNPKIPKSVRFNNNYKNVHPPVTIKNNFEKHGAQFVKSGEG